MQKFIVTSDGIFRFGNVDMHRQLLQRGDICIGGGVYEFDYVGQTMLLSGRSYDYGRVRWTDLDTLTMPSSLRGLSFTYEDLPLEHFVKIRFAD